MTLSVEGPRAMPSAQLIVCETTSRWAVALRRQMMRSGSSLSICETRSLDACWQQARSRPASVVVLELTESNLEQVAVALRRYQTRLPRVPVAVLGNRDLAPAQWVMRELGAVHAGFSSRELQPLVRIIQRHCSRIKQQSERDEAPWRRLPWDGAEQSQEDDPSCREPAWLREDRS